MNIQIDLAVPAIAQTYNLNIPNDVPINQLISLISNTVETLSSFKYISSGNENLFHQRKHTSLMQNITLSQAGVCNGDLLFLM